MKRKIAQAMVVAVGALALAGGTGAASAAQVDRAPAGVDTVVMGSCDNAPNDPTKKPSAAAAVKWFADRKGSTKYQGCCQKSVGLAWNRKTKHPSAIAFWRSSDGKRHTSGKPPKGAFVFWNISSYGHVGIADGNGGFWATSVNGKIGHKSSVNYFKNYLGWKAGNNN
ncbi:hypothetical protein [Amycolatopsis suaedae]|uniref:CHAP domain-containing protein n=1 Tax=Amycolatopsis suaedae TaxID=2510978 RepID=A0A4Q7IZK7_9PSEU|nr:hypothetical protein [Amycolatopsis suaedae]RZQ59533.1 hypothetical protein EWH70_33625 [Amycolatopsis suaedae]